MPSRTHAARPKLEVRERFFYLHLWFNLITSRLHLIVVVLPRWTLITKNRIWGETGCDVKHWLTVSIYLRSQIKPFHQFSMAWLHFLRCMQTYCAPEERNETFDWKNYHSAHSHSARVSWRTEMEVAVDWDSGALDKYLYNDVGRNKSERRECAFRGR